MAKDKSKAAPPADDVTEFTSPFEGAPDTSLGEVDGRPMKPEEAALAKAGPPITPPPEGQKLAQFGTPRKPGPGPFPRICHPLERKGNGQTRFKVRAVRGIESQPYRYILAANAAEALACYCEFQKLDAADPNLKTVVTELED